MIIRETSKFTHSVFTLSYQSSTMAQDTKPSLRISHLVYGRKNEGKRVKYLLDPDSDQYAIPEDIVLIRWRKRRHPNASFSGARLGPHLWRALAYALGHDCSAWPLQKTESLLEQAREALRAGQGNPAYLNSLPALATWQALWTILRPRTSAKAGGPPQRSRGLRCPRSFSFRS